METNLIGFPFTDTKEFICAGVDNHDWIFNAPNADEVVHIKSIVAVLTRTGVVSYAPNYIYLNNSGRETVIDRITQAPSNGDTTGSVFRNHSEIYLNEGQSLRIHLPDIAPGDIWYVTAVGERNYLSNKVQVPS